MKSQKISDRILQIVILIVVVLTFTQCKHNDGMDQGLNTFFATVFFIIFMIIGGIPAIIFSAISVKSVSNSMKVIAIVFVSILGLCSLVSIPMYNGFWRKGSQGWISFIVAIQYGSLILSIILIAVGANNKKIAAAQQPVKKQVPVQPTSDDDIDYMDEILND